MGLLFELIKQAGLSGADIVKFQLGWRANKGEINALGDEELLLIKKCCEYHNIEPMFSIFTKEALEMVRRHEFTSYKVASRTVVDNPNLVSEIINLGKRTFISLGMTDKQTPFGNAENIEYLWCKSEYPALPWALKDLPKNFLTSEFTGYSDHSIGIEVPIMAIVRGASVIEKHLTLDKSDTTIRDHALSATPDEFYDLVRLGKSIYQNLCLGV
jgi:sialic acid synthase SpsE